MEKQTKDIVPFIASAGFILFFLILNIYTPMVSDDYVYFNETKSIHDIFTTQYEFYLEWTGRIISLFFIRVFLVAGKAFFNIANALFYCFFIFLVQFHITGTFKKMSSWLFLGLNVFFWFFVSAWGEVFLWVSGSCNYLWTTAMILFFLVPFRKKQDNPEYNLNTPLSILFFIAGIFAGLSLENLSAAALFLLIAYCAVKIMKKNRFALFEVLGIIGFLIGFSLLIAAPGNYNREGVERLIGDSIYYKSFIVTYLLRFLEVSVNFVRCHGFPIMLVSAFFGFDIVYHQKRRLNMFSYFYALAAAASAYSMLLSPIHPDRAFFIVSVFSVITFGSVLKQMELQPPMIIKRNMALFSLVILACVLPFILIESKDVVLTYLRYRNRIEHILSEKEKGNLDIKLKLIIPKNEHTVPYEDLGFEKYAPVVSKYFGLKSISRDEEEWGSFSSDKKKMLRQLFIPPNGTIKKIRQIK